VSPTIVIIIGFVVLFLLFLSRMPIAFVMALVGFLGFSYLVSIGAGLNLVAKDMYAIFSSFVYTAVPMFVWMGYIAFHMGISKKLYTAAYQLIGHLRGGLAAATIGACGAFGAVCGSTTATAATMGVVALPEMRRYKYSDSLATATVASGGILGALIPPSVLFIIYGIATEQSISELFVAGIFPGILLLVLFIGTIYILTLRNPRLGPAGPKANFKEKVAALSGGTGETIAVFGIVMGGLFVGFFTPTEAGAVGAASVLLVALSRRQLSWQGFIASVADTTKLSAMIFMLVAGAVIFGRFITISGISTEVAGWAGGLPLPRFVILGIVLFFLLVLGCFMDGVAVLLLTLPIVFPLIMTLGYDPIWFGVVMVVVTGLGMITPPVGLNVYVVYGVVKDVPLVTIFRGIWPFVGAIIICIAILIAFPQIAVFLPSLMK